MQRFRGDVLPLRIELAHHNFRKETRETHECKGSAFVRLVVHQLVLFIFGRFLDYSLHVGLLAVFRAGSNRRST
jgi:hypothetical protein